MRRIREITLKYVGIVAFVSVVLLLASCEISAWQECRADHSVYYCMRVLGK